MIQISRDIENLGPLAPAHASLFKTRWERGEVTVVKLLPHPVTYNHPDFLYFKQQLDRLVQAYKEFGTGLPRVLSSGLTQTGSYPYYEMDFVPGVDLEERSSGFLPVSEIIAITERVGWTLRHVHTAGIKHGTLDTGSIRYNEQTGKYTLTGFWYDLLTPQQQAANIQQASTGKFAAPEQNEGRLLFETDVYRFGVVVYRLLTGRFPASSITGNTVLFGANIVALRRQIVPEQWPAEKRAAEEEWPLWLTELVEKCLQRQPSDRFYSGVDLYNHILYNHKFPVEKRVRSAGAHKKGSPLPAKLPQKPPQKAAPIVEKKVAARKVKKRFPGYVVAGVIGLVAMAVAVYLFMKPADGPAISQTASTKPLEQTFTDSGPVNSGGSVPPADKVQKPPVGTTAPPSKKQIEEKPVEVKIAKRDEPKTGTSTTVNNNTGLGKYKVRSKAYFHNSPDAATRRDAFIVHWNNAVLYPLKEEDDFVYIVFTNFKGQTSKGWLHKKDLVSLEE